MSRLARHSFGIALIATLIVVIPVAHGQTFTTVDYPGATSTSLTGINDSGVVVGNAPYGFQYAGGSFSTIYVSGSTYTYANGVSASGCVVGSYRYALGTTEHGFLYCGGTFSTIDVPGSSAYGNIADDTSAQGISSDGTYIVGYYITGAFNAPNPSHAFILHGGAFSTFDAPPCNGVADHTSANGVNNSGQVVGSCNGTYGFLYSAGVFSSISFPGALQTVPVGINNSGDISGFYVDATGLHGFIYRAGTYFPVNAANSTLTGVSGINNSGDCVGSYTASSQSHGFIETGLTGYVDPKFIVLSVTYAPPGPSSGTFVQYQNSQLVGTTLTLTQSFQDKSTFGASGTLELGMPKVVDGQITATTSDEVSETTTNTSSIMTSMQVQQGEKTFGTNSYFAPVNHDYDLIWVWLNPAAIFSLYDYGSFVWKGYGFDGADQPGMDIVGIQLGYLNGDFGPVPAQYQASLGRSWAANQVWPSGEGPALTDADLAQIASFDPFSDPSYGPKYFGANPPTPGTSDSRFMVSSCSASAGFPYNQAAPSESANIYTCTLTYTNSSTQTTQVSSTYSQTFSVDASVSLGGEYTKFIAKFTAKLSDSTMLTWTRTQQNSSTMTSTSTASLSVQGPPCNNTVPGVGPCVPIYDSSGDEPTQFLIYQDNLYGTFVFVPDSYYTAQPPTAATPAFSLPAGVYSPKQTVTITDTTPGVAIYYTTDGTMPTMSSSLYSGPITLLSSVTLEAIATSSSYSDSSVATAAYTIETPAATPTFSVPAGTYTSAQTVTISDATNGATIYYTTNGTAPTTSSSVYSGPISVSSSETLEAIAAASGDSNSAVATAAYAINIPGNPLPFIGSISPAYTSAGGAPFTLTVGGSGFTANSTVYWGTSALVTTYVSATQLTANVPATDIANAAVAFAITVQTPMPGGGTSNTLQFEVDSAGSGATGPTFATLTATVAAGSTASYSVTLPSDATGISVACLNLPAGATCSYSSSTNMVTIATSSTTPAGTYQVTVVFTETVPSGATAGMLLPISLLPLVFLRRKMSARGVWATATLGLVLIAMAAFSIGCGGGANSTTTPPVGQTQQVTSSGVVSLTVQ